MPAARILVVDDEDNIRSSLQHILTREGYEVVTVESGEADPSRRWVYDPAPGFSKSRNSPWAGRELVGRVLATWVGGRLVYQQGRGVLAR